MKDLIIIGGGPAGLTAGLYAARAKIDVVLLEKMAPGGQVLSTDWIENYPGFPEGVSGFELMERIRKQADRFDLKIRLEEVIALDISDEKKVVETAKSRMECRALIIACGSRPRKVGIEGEDLFTGKGVSYCATCDGAFFRDQEVAVIGGGDSALEEAIYLTRFVRKVYLIHRRDQFRAVKILQERVKENSKIEPLLSHIPLKIVGSDGVEAIELKDLKEDRVYRKEVQGVFVFIGTIPNTELVRGILELDAQGFIITDQDMQTSIPGVFAAGDIRSKSLRQISTAVGDGATAAFAVQRYLES